MHPIFASLEASAPAHLGDFLTTLYHELIALAKQGIDTPEERQGIEVAVGKYFDQYFAAKLPATMAATFRKSLLDMVDATLVAANSLS